MHQVPLNANAHLSPHLIQTQNVLHEIACMISAWLDMSTPFFIRYIHQMI
uniref:Uncharacterized protein n=1 Tax=Rhizophora mucronata TaxID=61149 RepID=A0A2P2NWX4_RHIMU